VKRVLVPLAEGFEELEAVTIIDLLRRAGVEVIVAALAGNPVKGAHGIAITADVPLDAVAAQDFDLIALPGGMPGAEHLKQDPRIRRIVGRLHQGGSRVAAICAAPMVLAAAGVLSGRRATSYPGFLENAGGATVVGDAVVVDDRVITARGPGTALDFALELVAQLLGPAARQRVELPLQRSQPGH